jgi:recombination protein RecA
MQPLEQAVQAIHLRFGSQALARAHALPQVQPWPSGCDALDHLSGIGGLPRGRLSLLQGHGTCGKTSLALWLLARAGTEFAQSVVIDPGLSFDPWSLASLGGDLATLTVVRLPEPAATGEAAISLAKAGAGFLLLLLPSRVLNQADRWLSQLGAAAERSGTVVLAVAETAPAALAHTASLGCGLERIAWIHERHQLTGLRTRIRCLKNKVAAPGAEVEIEVRYPNGATLFPERALSEVRLTEVTRWAVSAAV